ncbi:hypothetical protein HZH68_008144 [Vespula germanica]|uniref:Uncharacterized protein n=1 Tax=Vespula germanica TaxID=30212 RepID=A0A834K517_VESGE|nr:hypothetical protein HZH68_008144 [Vespula germanica]
MGTKIGKRPEKSVATSSDIADGDILGRRGKKIEPVRIVSTGAVAIVAAAATDDDNEDDNDDDDDNDDNDDDDDDNNENDNDNDYDDDSETNDVDDDAIDIKHNQWILTPSTPLEFQNVQVLRRYFKVAPTSTMNNFEEMEK